MTELDDGTNGIVVKVGGSLLDQTHWVQALIARLQSLPFDRFLILVGGGEAIEAMRKLDQVHTLDMVAMHWRCISMLTATYEVACELFERELFQSQDSLGPAASFRIGLDDSTKIRAWLHSKASNKQLCERIRIVDIGSVYREPHAIISGEGKETANSSLPEDWRTTSDSLAIWLARTLQIRNILLLKSCPIPPEVSLHEARRRGIVDEAVEFLFDPSSMHCRIEQLV